MSNPSYNNMFLNFLITSLMKKVVVPTEFHGQVGAVKTMLKNDVSGLVDTLTDFAVQCASVNYSIETSNDTLNSILKKWLKMVNIEYLGKIFPGIDAVAEEYYKERWKYSSFPVLRVAGWQRVDGLRLPTKLIFLDGGSIYAQDKDKDATELSMFTYDYYLGDPQKNNKLDKNTIITKPYGRFFDKYPTPYLIKRGIYSNFKIIESLKNKQNELLEQILPYMFLVKKGSEVLARERIKTYSNDELNEVINQFQKKMDNYIANTSGDKTTKSWIRATNFDEQLQHMIPDMTTMFKEELFATAEKNIITGMGFIDIAEAVSISRKESILNPKVFIEETRKGVKDFRSILNTIMLMIWNENTNNVKFKNVDYKVVSTPINTFITNDFKQELRLLWKHGQLSNQTYAELVGEVDYSIEKKRREQEAKDGTETIMYPHITDNTEKDTTYEENLRNEQLKNKPKQEEDEDGNPIPEDKLDETESKDKYDVSSKEEDLETAPYRTVNDLDPKIKKALSPDLRKTFIEVWNNAYKTYGDETRAFRVSWNLIRKIARKNKKGIWVRKRKHQDGKLKAVKLTKAMVEDAIEKEAKQELQSIQEALELKKMELVNAELERTKVQTELGKKLLKKDKSKEK